MKKRTCLLICNILLLCVHSLFAKDRVIILTDIAGEPDDTMSMVRLMLYSNEFDLEGLIATTSCWMQNTPNPDRIESVIDAYALVRDNLSLHKADYPSADYLRSLVKKGNEKYSMGDVGDGKSSKGSQHIISVVDKDDPRPVWLCVWGGANTLAQALWDVQHNRSPQEVDEFVAKLRVYDLAGQDDCGAWMTNTFPYLYYIRSVQQWRGISQWVLEDKEMESRGGDQSVFTIEWVDENIQQNHGPLGEIYPDAAYLHEGDTPTWLYLLPTGLSDPNESSWGSWGGRFSDQPIINPYSMQPPVKRESDYEDFWMRSEVADNWQWQDEVYDNNIWAAVFRWRVDFQNDFAARMDWCLQPYDNANHNPVVILNQDSTKNILSMHVDPGRVVDLHASASDPDGDSLFYRWWIYAEPGTYQNEITLTDNETADLAFKIPEDAAGTTIHLVLTVNDAGDPSLYAYRRVVFYVEPWEEIVDTDAPLITDFPDTHFVDYRTQVPLSMQSDERAFFKFDFSDKSYADMQYEFNDGQGGVRHRAFVPVEHGQDVTMYVRAADLVGNQTTSAIAIRFSVDTLQTPIRWNDGRYLTKWPKGAAPLGFGFNRIKTTVKNVKTFYLKKTLHMSDPQEIEKIFIRVKFEDGLVAYVNGHELYRFNMPDGVVAYDTLASKANDATRQRTISIRGDNLAWLTPGDNVFAFEIHQFDDGDNDLYFDAQVKVDRDEVLPYGAEWRYHDLGIEPYVQTLGGIETNVASGSVPDQFALYQNFPNPFNAHTTISYQLEKSGHVTLNVYSITGQKVAELVDERQDAGFHRVVHNGSSLASGVYLIGLQAETQTLTRKMILIK